MSRYLSLVHSYVCQSIFSVLFDLNAAITFYKLLSGDFFNCFLMYCIFLFLKVIVLLHQTITFISFSDILNADYLAVVGKERELHFLCKDCYSIPTLNCEYDEVISLPLSYNNCLVYSTVLSIFYNS